MGSNQYISLLLKYITMRSWLLVSVLIVSGCTTFAGTSGVAIESFEPDFTNPLPGESVDFHVKVRNTGSVHAHDVSVELFGLGDWTIAVPSCQIGTLIAGGDGIPGDTRTCRLTATAPDVAQGLAAPYEAIARVQYRYLSTASHAVTIGTSEELKRIQDGGGTLPVQSSFSSSGPITLSIAQTGPIRVTDSSVASPVTITIANTGGGVVCHPDCSLDDHLNTIAVSVRVGDVLVSDCSREMSLLTNQNTLTCDVTFERPLTGLVQQTVTAETSYGYFLDVTTPVTVTSR